MFLVFFSVEFIHLFHIAFGLGCCSVFRSENIHNFIVIWYSLISFLVDENCKY